MGATTPRSIALAAAVAAFTAAPAPAASAWLDEPPRLCTFKLDDPTSARIPLLEAFADRVTLGDTPRPLTVDAGAGFRAWGRGRGQPLWPLAWAAPRPMEAGGTAGPPGSLEASGPLVRLEDPLSSPEASASPSPVLIDGDDGGLLGFEPAELALPPSMAPAGAPSWLGPLFTTPVIKTPLAMFASNGAGALWALPPSKPIPNWRCRRRPVRIARYGGESDAFPLVRCDGTVAPEAYDRLTLMVREALAPRPGELLPDEPDPEVMARGEWTPGVRLVHPRLLWVVQRLADAFPWRTIYVFSGYRHDPSGALPKPGTHHSMHSEARAMDISVMGIPSAALFQLCRKLPDVGCGYYPNNKFVHVDVRRPGSGHPFWIDVSGPGEPSRYVDAWPGVVEGGGLVWDASAAGAGRGRGQGEVSCTDRRAP